jgi:imidazolonepropionase-like amidohydrolase
MAQEDRLASRVHVVRMLASTLLTGGLLAGCASAPPVASPPPPGSGTLAVRGTLVRPDGSALPDAIVLVQSGRVTQVGPAATIAVPPGSTSIGGADRFIVPGLIDAHVHFFQSGGLHTRPDVIDTRAIAPYAGELSAIHAGLSDTFRRYLRAGTTTVIDFGGPLWNFEIRDTASRTALAPRVAVAGPLLSSVSRPQLDLGDPPIVQVTDPEAARTMVRSQALRRPDFVKLWWVILPGETAQSWLPVARAAIEEAHALGLRVAVHATQLETARTALRAGADVLVHGVADADVDDDFVALLRARKVPYVTTLAVHDGYASVLGKKPRLDAPAMELGDPAIAATWLETFEVPQGRYGRRWPAAAWNVRRVWDAGALVVAGSDAGNIGTLHGAGLHEELELLVAAGLSPVEALQAATVNGARLLGWGDVGVVAQGARADLLVLGADPRTDVRNLRRIDWVVKDGVALRPDAILPRTAEQVVQAQLNAYNAQDLEAFLSTYAEDATIVKAGTGEVLNAGHESLRERYGTMFRKYPSNRARIAERRVEGGRVSDHEIITGRAPERPDPWDVGWVVYEVADGRIHRVTLP